MCRIAELQLEAAVSAPKVARTWITRLLDRWEVTHLSDVANLLTSELVSNAVRHARSGSSITASIADGFLEVGVTDGEPDKLPMVRSTEDPTASDGRGMAIVEALSADWGTTVLPMGKQVWFRIEATDWTYVTACRCHADHLDKVILNSGRQVVANPGPWDDVGPG
jgi:anti-sigma regulatory factor (Ser/Thr protein kinase)